MSYSITGMIAAPDVGYKAERRMTPTGAKDLAVSLRAEGHRDVEIRDDRGNALADDDLEREIAENSASERDLAARLKPR